MSKDKLREEDEDDEDEDATCPIDVFFASAMAETMDSPKLPHGWSPTTMSPGRSLAARDPFARASHS